MRLSLVTPPAELPVTLAELKAQVVAEYDHEDLLLQHYLDAAVSHLDGWHGVLGRCLVTQTWRADITRLGESIALPFPDIQIVSADFTDQSGGVMAYEWHESLARPALMLRGGWGRPGSVTFTAGFGPASVVPAAIKQAILLLAGTWVRNRESIADDQKPIPHGFEMLIRPFRWMQV